MLRSVSIKVLVALCAFSILLAPGTASAQELSSKEVLRSIKDAREFLVSQQNNNGSWTARGTDRYKVGVSSLALLSLLNAGMTADDPPIADALNYLRSIEDSEATETYEVSLMIMALATAKDGQRDNLRIANLAQKLENGQVKRGQKAGLWSYSVVDALVDTTGDRSNGQFAILGLREAVHAGVSVDRETWRRARDHWVKFQNNDGGWGYRPGSPSSGSMTVAGISTMIITDSMLKDDDDLNSDGTPNCCPEPKRNEALERGIRWMENHFAVGHNPGNGTWLLYYLYGLERAGRLGARRFFGDHDWYREGAKFLVDRQSQRNGSWKGVGGMEDDPVIGTSLALLFLSKGLAPVLVNKLKFGPEGDDPDPTVMARYWNNHTDDIRNLTHFISGRPKWPKLLTWQVADLDRIVNHGDVNDLMQAPVLFISGRERPEFTDAEIELLKQFIDRGGFIFAVANCHSAEFDDGFRALIEKMFPQGVASLKPLPDEHPVFRSEFLLEPESVELLGVDAGCRTAIIYSPDDLSCLWDKWARQDPPDRPAQLKSMITKATRVGTNVIAYVTGREPPQKNLDLDGTEEEDGQQDRIERGLLQIAKLRHSGGWDAAPRALKNLLMALNQMVGMTASTKQKNLPVTDPDIYKYPILYMHGRNGFDLSRQEQEQLKLYLQRGGVLFADACCGSDRFDRSFRGLMRQMFTDRELKRIPPNHEIFTTSIGHDLKKVKRRSPEVDSPDAALNTQVVEGEPYLEGIKMGNRYAVIYSKYDISCALERQASLACEGYVHEDAVKIGINIVLYAMLQDLDYAEAMK